MTSLDSTISTLITEFILNEGLVCKNICRSWDSICSPVEIKPTEKELLPMVVFLINL